MQHRTNSICGLKPPVSSFIRFADGPAPTQGAKGYATGCIYLQTIDTPAAYINVGNESSADWSLIATSQEISSTVGSYFAGSGDNLPTSATAVVGQLFIKTGNTSPGLYVCTAATSSASTWKTVSHAS